MKKRVQSFLANLVLISVIFTLIAQPLHELNHHFHNHDLQEHQEKQSSQNASSITEKCPICEFHFVKSSDHQPFCFKVERCFCKRIESLPIFKSHCENRISNIQLRAPPTL
jgi:endogenous inhibitor of DNA gyrase (YacG/DUF329 family)